MAFKLFKYNFFLAHRKQDGIVTDGYEPNGYGRSRLRRAHHP